MMMNSSHPPNAYYDTVLLLLLHAKNRPRPLDLQTSERSIAKVKTEADALGFKLLLSHLSASFINQSK